MEDPSGKRRAVAGGGRPSLEPDEAAAGELADAGGAVAEPLGDLDRAQTRAEAEPERRPVAGPEAAGEAPQIEPDLRLLLPRRLRRGELLQPLEVHGQDAVGALTLPVVRAL